MAAMSMAEFEAEIADMDGAVESKNILVYGDGGVGKSHLTAALPRNLVLAFEPGWETIRRVAKKINNPVKFVQINTHQKLEAAIQWLESGGYKQFDWVTPDGLSTLQTKLTLGFTAEAHDANPAKRASRNIPDRTDYFNAQNLIKDFTARLVDLPVNTFWTAHSMRIDNSDGVTEIWPLIEGKENKVSNYVTGLMHAVGVMAVKKDDTRQITWNTVEVNDMKVIAKDQFSLLPRYHKNPTMPEILKILEGGSSADQAESELKAPQRAAAK